MESIIQEIEYKKNELIEMEIRQKELDTQARIRVSMFHKEQTAKSLEKAIVRNKIEARVDQQHQAYSKKNPHSSLSMII